MKSVLISIQPKWVEKIASGKKTIEVRKTRPKLETPFKCYIYETITRVKETVKEYDCDFRLVRRIKSVKQWGGKVIGEFVCDKITDISVVVRNCNENYNEVYHNDECKGSCLTWKELQEYGKGKPLYGWHIRNLKIYDKPKELSEFYIYDGEKRRPSIDCEHKKPGYSHDWCLQMDGRFCNQCLCDKKRLTRPPQSWCYVESGV